MKKDALNAEQSNALIELAQVQLLTDMIYSEIIAATPEAAGRDARLEPAFCLLQDTLSRKLSALYQAFDVEPRASLRGCPLDCPPDSP